MKLSSESKGCHHYVKLEIILQAAIEERGQFQLKDRGRTFELEEGASKVGAYYTACA